MVTLQWFVRFPYSSFVSCIRFVYRAFFVSFVWSVRLFFACFVCVFRSFAFCVYCKLIWSRICSKQSCIIKGYVGCMSTRPSSSTSLNAIKFNSKIITDRGNPLEYYLKFLLQSIKQRKTVPKYVSSKTYKYYSPVITCGSTVTEIVLFMCHFKTFWLVLTQFCYSSSNHSFNQKI